MKYDDGTNIPQDLTGASGILIASGTLTTINNVVNGNTYYFLGFSNNTGVSVDFALFRNGSKQCISTVAPSAAAYQFGYYLLSSSDAEVRYYKQGQCASGSAYRFWNAAAIQSAMGSAVFGYLTFTATTPP